MNRDIENWVNALDNMGPFAPLATLREHLEAAPDGAPAELVQGLAVFIDQRNQANRTDPRPEPNPMGDASQI